MRWRLPSAVLADRLARYARLTQLTSSRGILAKSPSNRHKAVINIFLGGGPPHQDMWDIKEDAPAEIRGEFKSIATKVEGIRIGECFPRIAQIMDKCAVIRSVSVVREIMTASSA